MTELSPQELLAAAEAKQRAAADPAVSAWVRANAGTGKTHVLVQRMLRLLLSGASPRSILCLTFTKNAAAEMATRVLGKLGEWATADRETLTANLAKLLGRAPSSAELAAAPCLFASVIDAPGGLSIMTIHGFCERVLRRYSFEANVPPGFTVLTEEEAQVAALHYDISEIGEMHHNSAKNVLYVRASIDEIGRRMKLSPERVNQLLASAKRKMYAARLQRPTPYVDKTVYVGWNSLCVSAYLEAAKVLGLTDARKFALRSLDRVLSTAWRPQGKDKNAGDAPLLADFGRSGNAAADRHLPRLLHVVAYSDPKAEHREVPGMLDDYAFTALACLDAYEATADLSYFKFAHAITDAMSARFFDPTSGGFFDSEPSAGGNHLGVLATRRKPLQDSPTPAGNPMAAIALMRLHHYTGDSSYRDKAEMTLETFAGVAEQFGIFAATYGIAVVHFLDSPVQIVVIAGDDGGSTADDLYQAAVASFAFTKTTLRLAANQAVAENLPPGLAATIPNLPPLKSGRSFAVLCSGSTCQPPVFTAAELKAAI